MISGLRFTLELSLGTALSIAQDPAPPAAATPSEVPAPTGPVAIPYRAPVPGPPPPPTPPRRLVFAFVPSVMMGISPLPSFNLAGFLGGRLPRSPWALGYQLTFSSGFADRYFAGLLAHRHHLTAMRSFGARDRGFTSVGGGVAFLARNPVVETEGRIGLRFGTRRRGIVALQVRLGWDIGHREQAPMPQFGVVFGFGFL